MRLSIFGLGYVGTVSAACLAARGHDVIGVDLSEAKVRLVNSGTPTIMEGGLLEILKQAGARGKLRATTSAAEAVSASDCSLICVGTPSARNGSLDTGHLLRAVGEVGAEIAKKSERHTVVVRSTMLPGTFRKAVVPALERSSGKKFGKDFNAVVNPEFLREGTAVADFHNPEKTMVGADDPAAGAAVLALYDGLPGRHLSVSPEIAELAKYVDNVWHALKVCFANEIGNICKSLGIDSHAVMENFLSDRKLNISPAYLKPGYAFGGSCLPKDARAIAYLARTYDLELPLLQSVIPGNNRQMERALDWVLSFGKKRIAILGCAFKAGTDDLRESPYVILAERLLGKGCEIHIFDESVNLSMLVGANRDYVLSTIPHIANLMVDSAAKAAAEADIIIVSARTPAYIAAAQTLRPDQMLLDFAHIPELKALPNYEGVNW